ncbi:MAG: hypothetical protein M3355_02945 [Actinomycetota bacterium]|nr:hypothetical protein [Actinomycetota bacterium]
MSGSKAESGNRLGALALVALLIVSLAFGIFVLRARTPDLALEVTSFPKELDDRGFAQFAFFVRFDEPDATVEVVGRDQEVARTLAPSIALEADRPMLCNWDGRDDEGEKIEPGRYRLRVSLPGEERLMVFPRRLDIQPGARDGKGSVTGQPCVPEAGG